MTFSKDKTVAIAGLQNRLAKFYDPDGKYPITDGISDCIRYGIVRRYLHKSLLWQRSGEQKMERINPSERIGVVPSWSWMAYQGEIQYRTSDLHGLDWQHVDLPSGAQEQHILKGQLGRVVQSCYIEGQKDTNSKIRDAEGRLVGWIRYDCESEDNIERLGCIAVAQHRYPTHSWAVFGEDADTWKKYAGVSWDEKLVPGDFHYVLLVKCIPLEGEDVAKVYCRLGVAVIQSGYLSFEPPLTVRVV